MSNPNKETLKQLNDRIILQDSSSAPIAGTLISSTGDYIHLRQYHTFGRSTDSHTHLPSTDISRIHTVIFWQDDNWYIEDKSSNGVWVNNQKLLKDQAHLLHKNDTIVLSSKAGKTFTMINDYEPCDALISVGPQQDIIHLKKPITTIEGEFSCFYEQEGWYLIYDDDRQDSKLIEDGNTLKIKGSLYRLQSNHMEFETSENKPTARSVNDLEFRLTVSADEENIQLHIQDDKQSTIIEGHRIQSLLYLLLCLARKSIEDSKQGYSECHCGWIKLNELSKSLGIEPDNARIRLHRLRTRIRNTVSFNGVDACELLQLQDGEVRLNTSKVVVMKGNNLESSVDCH